ncbi:RelA/SpoT domain-containing protein [Amycolatopsis sp. FDAARGOS 1241]|uniref:RelA/SpoT domain-containing protein n=1 Tax=Amycolatopsis sp. FDAARGOS 1241 TaxID=2778070 RepID=UPI001950EF61|nr:RelA/SpoT domain-containing protein [Amycolatopsis sp. FDAARGOS 1241]QRP47332.1 RelA/SpoT domain-containing protein [Amycolatopsis sp. FDAARGOS 1241]
MTERVPTSFAAKYADLESLLRFGVDELEARLKASLSGLRPVAIQARVKSIESAYAKFQRGEYAKLEDVDDLVALRAVFLHPSDLPKAIGVIRQNFEVLLVKNDEAGKPHEFNYRQPHISFTLPTDYLARHGELSWLKAELQLTTYIQHALQESVHDVIYKGVGFSWQEHRLDGRLRGLLEIVDSVLENVANVAKIENEPKYETFDKRNEIIATSAQLLGESRMPTDRRRFAITIERFLAIAAIDIGDLTALAEKNSDIVNALSLNPADKILGILLRERLDVMIKRVKGKKIFVSSELREFLPEFDKFPAGNLISI